MGKNQAYNKYKGRYPTPWKKTLPNEININGQMILPFNFSTIMCTKSLIGTLTLSKVFKILCSSNLLLTF
jgi:hypothetical protein